MSYILDALRKSEEERQPRDLGALTPVQRSRSQRRSNPWLTGLVLVLVCNAVLLGYLTFGRDRLDNISSTSLESGTITNALTAGEPAIATPPAPAIAPANTAQMELDDTVHNDEAITIRPSAQTNDINQLLASLTFTSHVYADDPTLRSVMIDGRVFREGDTPRIGVDLVSITSTGVVLRYRGREVAYNVLAQWE
ncbi:MAG: general secretion pathway protein GspB [Pseudomonadota bacterium]